MRLSLLGLALAAFATVLQAQEASYRFPFTYFLGGSDAAVGPGGDIWSVGVSNGPGLSVADPDGNPPPNGACQTGGYHDDIAHLFPYLGPCSDLVAMRLAGDGSGIVFSKFLGGTGVDSISGIALDADGRAYLTGSRAASPDSQPGTSSYLIALEPDGAEIFDMELPVEFVPQAIALDMTGEILVGGDSRYIEGQSETYWTSAEVLRVDPTSHEVIAVAKLQGKGRDRIRDIAVAEDGVIYVVGETQSFDLPFTKVYATPNPNPYPRNSRDYDIFVAALSRSNEWTWIASLGGSGDEAVPRIVWKESGELLVAAETESGDLPEHDWVVPSPGGRLWTATLDAASGTWLRGGRLGYYGDANLDGLARDSDGTIYLAGHGKNPGEPFPSGFAARLDARGTFSTHVPVGRDTTVVAAKDGRVVVGGSSAGPGSMGGWGLSGTGEVFLAPLEFEAPAGAPRLEAIVNAAGRLAAPLSPGAVVSIYGEQLGPATPVGASPGNNRFPTSLAGVEVLVGGRSIPLLFVSAGQINAVLPFVLGASPLVELKVVRDGQTSNTFQLTTADTAPELFSVVINSDGTSNSAEKPALRGETVSVWLSGVGTFSPTREDGSIEGTAGPFPQIDAPVRVLLAGQEAAVTYAGAAPGLVAGMAQINFVIPETVQDGRNLIVWVGEGQDSPAARGSVAVLP